MRTKVNRLFCGVREALQLLGSSDSLVDDGKGCLITPEPDSMAEVFGKSGLNGPVKGTTNGVSTTGNETRPASAPPSQPIGPSISISTAGAAPSGTTTGSTNVSPLLSFTARDLKRNMELQLVERVKLAYMHLKRAETSVGNIATAAIDASLPIWPGPGPDPSMVSETLAVPVQQSVVPKLSQPPTEVPTRTSSRPKSANLVATLPRGTDLRLDFTEPIDGDLGASTSSTATATSASRPQSAPSIKDCPQCLKYKSQLETSIDLSQTLRSELRRVWANLAEERAHREKAQMSRDILEQELEELTAQLFDQANGMVAEETRLRVGVEGANRTLLGQVARLERALRGKEDALRALQGFASKRKSGKGTSSRSSLAGSKHEVNGHHQQQQQIKEDKHQHLRPVPLSTAIPRGSSRSLATPSTSVRSSTEDLSSQLTIDGLLLAEFKDHVAVAAPGSGLPYDPVEAHSTAFLRRCLVEDVEPCIYYGFSGLGTWKGPASVQGGVRKKLLESCVAGTCIVRPVDELMGSVSGSNLALSANSLQVAAKIKEAISDAGNVGGQGVSKCYLCSCLRECEYRLFLPGAVGESVPTTPIQGSSEEASSGSNDLLISGHGLPLCLWCRERVAAVRGFYDFVRRLAAAGSGSSVGIETFRQAVMWRTRMAVARVGCLLGQSERESGWTPCSPGVAGDWEGETRMVR